MRSTLTKLLALTIAILSLAAGPASAQDRPNAYYLSVGVDRYKSDAINDLAGCVNDAKDVAEQLRLQKGKLFESVTGDRLVDQQATRVSILRGLTALKGKGKRGDYVFICLSGHGSRHAGQFYFLPHDYEANSRLAGGVTQGDLVPVFKDLMDEGKTVVVIVDACFSGQLRQACRVLLHTKTTGGLVLMVASSPSQTSLAMGSYSAYARAVVEAMGGQADLDGDGVVTLRELRQFAYHRARELTMSTTRHPGMLATEQDGECEASLSISETLPLAHGKRTNVVITTPTKSSTAMGNTAVKDAEMIPFKPTLKADAKLGSIVGTWETDALSRLRTGRSFRIVFAADGSYQAESSEGAFNRGFYRLEAGKLTLEFANGIDEVSVSFEGGKEMTFTFQGRGYTMERK